MRRNCKNSNKMPNTGEIIREKPRALEPKGPTVLGHRPHYQSPRVCSRTWGTTRHAGTCRATGTAEQDLLGNRGTAGCTVGGGAARQLGDASSSGVWGTAGPAHCMPSGARLDHGAGCPASPRPDYSHCCCRAGTAACLWCWTDRVQWSWAHSGWDGLAPISPKARPRFRAYQFPRRLPIPHLSAGDQKQETGRTWCTSR